MNLAKLLELGSSLAHPGQARQEPRIHLKTVLRGPSILQFPGEAALTPSATCQLLTHSPQPRAPVGVGVRLLPSAKPGRFPNRSPTGRASVSSTRPRMKENPPGATGERVVSPSLFYIGGFQTFLTAARSAVLQITNTRTHSRRKPSCHKILLPSPHTSTALRCSIFPSVTFYSVLFSFL